MWRCHHVPGETFSCWPMLGSHDLWAVKALYRAITICEDIRFQSHISGRSNDGHSAKCQTTTPRFDDIGLLDSEKILKYPRTYKMLSKDKRFQFDRVKSFLICIRTLYFIALTPHPIPYLLLKRRGGICTRTTM